MAQKLLGQRTTTFLSKAQKLLNPEPSDSLSSKQQKKLHTKNKYAELHMIDTQNPYQITKEHQTSGGEQGTSMR